MCFWVFRRTLSIVPRQSSLHSDRIFIIIYTVVCYEQLLRCYNIYSGEAVSKTCSGVTGIVYYFTIFPKNTLPMLVHTHTHTHTDFLGAKHFGIILEQTFTRGSTYYITEKKNTSQPRLQYQLYVQISNRTFHST